MDAVARRAEQELGTRLSELHLTLPTFRYDATMPNGVRENELCPVFTAVAAGDVHPDPSEVHEAAWVDWPVFRDDVLAGVPQISPWSALQVRALAAAEVAPGVFAAASAEQLPPAARPHGTG